MFRPFRRAAPAAELVLYVRGACPLCDELERELRAAVPTAARDLARVDVDSDLALVARFGSVVPVLTVGGRVAFKARARPEAIAPRIERLTRIALERGPLRP
ncbi:MAG: glutaredoxin family protein [Planctomycetes bacterium]|nr:glutaredoxin family protein [Planctomycetota bacterium]MCB9903341.1 glutaredoxin family protein [Planctomycetota bacterium]